MLLIDAHSELPEMALALQAAGLAKVVSEGAAAPHGGAERIVVDLGEGLRAWVRTGDLLFPGGPPPAADVVLTPEEALDPEAAVRAAQRLLAEPWPAPAASVPPAAAPAAHRPAADYPELLAPPLGMRLLAACRAWGVIHHFYPYLELIGDWDAAFLAALPAFAAAEGEAAYARAVLELMAHVADGHTRVSGHPAIAGLEGGAARPPVDVRLIEDRVVVVAFDSAVAGLRPGDVVLAVDGEPLAARMERLLPLTTASTEATRRVRAARRALGGPADSTAVLEVEGANGARRRVEVKRGAPSRPAPPAGKPWRRLAPRIGYVDLQWLELEQVDAMLEELRDTSALVFDMRGYPNGTAWRLAPRLNRRGAKAAALFRRRELSAEGFQRADSGYFFAQSIPATPEGQAVYPGETVMLIDERAISQAEHTGLFLEAASGTVFVGEPTAGATATSPASRSPAASGSRSPARRCATQTAGSCSASASSRTFRPRSLWPACAPAATRCWRGRLPISRKSWRAANRACPRRPGARHRGPRREPPSAPVASRRAGRGSRRARARARGLRSG